MAGIDRDTDRQRMLTRRVAILGGLKLGLFGLLGARLYYLQVVDGDRYTVLAEENRISLRLIAPSRGPITDRFGVPLAINDQNFRVVLVAEEATGGVESVLQKLQTVVPLSEDDLQRVRRDIERRRAFVPITVQENLSWDQVAWIEVNAPEMPGLAIEVGEVRRYPFARSTGHVVGYVGAVSESELNGDPVLTLPGFKIGKTGVERQHDLELRGSAGRSQVEVNAVGRVIRELDRIEGRPGSEVQLTIDIGLQEYIQQRLETEFSAAAVVMDVHRGDVLALVSHPGFDPNLFPGGISSADWRRLVDDPYGVLNNKAISGEYAPGSTFKMIVAAMALEEGEASPDQTVWCPGHMDLGNHRFHCWRRGGHGRIALVDALAQSCDVYFYEMARRLGIDRIAEAARRFGLGHRLNIDLPAERAGIMPDREWKRRRFDAAWQQGETLIAAIGQGYVLATPLQLATMTARLVNGGRAVLPRITASIGGLPTAPASEYPPIGFSQGSLDYAVAGMARVMTHGTARSSQIPIAGLEMGGKTGTSQVRRITMAERSAGLNPSSWPWEHRDHALFVGFAPLAAPRYACAVVVEHGGGGSSVAAPIARDILQECQLRESGRAVAARSGMGLGPTG